MRSRRDFMTSILTIGAGAIGSRAVASPQAFAQNAATPIAPPARFANLIRLRQCWSKPRTFRNSRGGWMAM